MNGKSVDGLDGRHRQIYRAMATPSMTIVCAVKRIPFKAICFIIVLYHRFFTSAAASCLCTEAKN